MSRPLGDNHLVEVGSGETPSYTPLLCSSRVTFNRRRNRVDRTCAGDANRRYGVGKPDSTLDITGPYDDTNMTLFTHLDAVEELPLRLQPDTTHGETVEERLYFEGPFILDGFSMEIPNDGGIDLSLTGVAAGNVEIHIPE